VYEYIHFWEMAPKYYDVLSEQQIAEILRKLNEDVKRNRICKDYKISPARLRRLIAKHQ